MFSFYPYKTITFCYNCYINRPANTFFSHGKTTFEICQMNQTFCHFGLQNRINYICLRKRLDTGIQAIAERFKMYCSPLFS